MMWVLRTPASRLVRQASTLGIIPLSITPSVDQVAALVGRQTRIRLVGFVPVAEDARRVGQEDELLGLERRGDGRGGGVGVDVQEPASSSSSSASEGSTGTTPARQRFSIGATSTSVTSPTRPRSIGSPSASGRVSLRPKRHWMRLVVQARGPAAELVDVPDDVGVDLLGQHPGDDLERGVVGVAPALDEPGLEAGLLHRHGDRLAAAVDDHRPHADGLHEDDVDQQGAERLGVFHHRAAELDDGEPAVELADVAQRLDQDIRLADRFLMHVAALAPLSGPPAETTMFPSRSRFVNRMSRCREERENPTTAKLGWGTS